MADHFTYYTLEEKEKKTIQETCDILSKLEENNTLNAHFNFTLVKNLLGLILTNENNKMRL